MALFNESLEGRFSRLIGGLHSMKGPNPTPQVTPEITHVIHISDDYDRKTHHYLEGSTRYGSGFFNLAADATHFSVLDFAVNATAGILATIEQIWVKSPAAVGALDMRTFAVAVAPGATGHGTPLDTREGTTKKSALVVTAQNTAIVGKSGGQIADQKLENNVETRLFVLEGFVISPGQHLTLFSDVINAALQLTGAIWRERAANPAELRVS